MKKASNTVYFCDYCTENKLMKSSMEKHVERIHDRCGECESDDLEIISKKEYDDYTRVERKCSECGHSFELNER